MIISLGRRSPGVSSNLPGSLGRAVLKRFPIWSFSGWGLPCLPRRRESGELLPRLFALTPTTPRRYVFCGTFLGVTPSSRYEPPCPAEIGLSSIRKRTAIMRPLQSQLITVTKPEITPLQSFVNGLIGQLIGPGILGARHMLNPPAGKSGQILKGLLV